MIGSWHPSTSRRGKVYYYSVAWHVLLLCKVPRHLSNVFHLYTFRGCVSERVVPSHYVSYSQNTVSGPMYPSWGYNIWVAFIQLDHSSIDGWNDIFIAHRIVINNSEVSTFPIVVFFRSCMFEVVVPSYSVICYIYVPLTLGRSFHYSCAV